MTNIDKSPKQVIDEIRNVRFWIGFDHSKASAAEEARFIDSQDFMRNASRLAGNIQSEKPHFVLELIQNADDNVYAEDSQPTVKFLIGDDIVILQNNEIGFKEENVRALCGVGDTTKQDRSHGYIGEKGIGFKSVFMVTDNPILYSNGFSFCFKFENANPTSIIIPHWVEEPLESFDKSETNIALPLKQEVSGEIRENIRRIDPSILLFLRKIQKIQIEDLKGNIFEAINRVNEDNRVKITSTDGTSYWKLAKKSHLIIPQELKEEKRKGVTETELILAFPTSKYGSALTNTVQNLFVFLPVRRYGFKFVIQGDFILPVNREDIVKDHSENSWNKFLKDNICTVFLEAIENFKQDEKLSLSYYDFIPTDEDVSDPYFSDVVGQIYSKMSESECILSDSGNWKKPRDLLRANKEERMLFPNNIVEKHLAREYVSNKIRIRKEILSALGVEVFDFDVLQKLLADHEYVSKQPISWFNRLYAYLMNSKLNKEQIAKSLCLRIFPLENNKVVSAEEETIFMPLDKKEIYGFEDELSILDRRLFKNYNLEQKAEFIKFLHDFGIKETEPYDIIEQHILPIYESSDTNTNWSSKTNNVLMGYVRYVKENFDEYKEKCKKNANGTSQPATVMRDPISRLKKSIYIKISKTDGKKQYYDHPANTFLPREYGNINKLELLFNGFDNGSFVHKSYLEQLPKKRTRNKHSNIVNKVSKRAKSSEIRKWKNFFIELGSNAGLKVVEIQDLSGSYLDAEERRKMRGNYAYSYTAEKIEDYDIEHLDRILTVIVSEKSKAKSIALLRLLENEWQRLGKFSTLKYQWKYYDWFPRTKDSKWLHTLKTTPWLQVKQGGFEKPVNIYSNSSEIKNLLGNAVPIVGVALHNKELNPALGIHIRVDPKAVVDYLKWLSSDNSIDIEVFGKLYDYLNNNFEDWIKDAFSVERIILIPSETRKHFTGEEVYWETIEGIKGNFGSGLAAHYPNLKSFFINKLGISEKPSIKDYSDFLTTLINDHTDDSAIEKQAMSIYNYINDELRRGTGNLGEIYNNEWWKEFIKRPIFWTNKREFWVNDNDIFVNDREDFYELFEGRKSIAFLELPERQYPKFQPLINSFGIPYLSNSIKVYLKDKTEEIYEEILTNKLQDCVTHAIDFLHYSDFEAYERAEKENKWALVNQIKILSVKELVAEYRLNEEIVNVETEALLDNDVLYVKRDSPSNLLFISREIFHLLGQPKGFDDFLNLLFHTNNVNEISALFRAKGISHLSPEMKSKLLTNLKFKRESTSSVDYSLNSNPNLEPHPVQPSEIIKHEQTAHEETIKDLSQVNDPNEVDVPEMVERISDSVPTRSAVPISNSHLSEIKEQNEDSYPDGEKGESNIQPFSLHEHNFSNEERSQDSDENLEMQNNFKPANHSPRKLNQTYDPEELIGEDVDVSEVDVRCYQYLPYSKPETHRNKEKSPTPSNDNYIGSLDYEEDGNESESENLKTGKWGEEYAMKYLSEVFFKDYAGGSYNETDFGFTIIHNGKVKVKVVWLNKEKEQRKDHDIELYNDAGVQFIEVKSTRSVDKHWFNLPINEWKLMKEKGDAYSIFRVYKARSRDAWIMKITNPYKFFIDGKIDAAITRIRI